MCAAGSPLQIVCAVDALFSRLILFLALFFLILYHHKHDLRAPKTHRRRRIAAATLANLALNAKIVCVSRDVSELVVADIDRDDTFFVCFPTKRLKLVANGACDLHPHCRGGQQQRRARGEWRECDAAANLKIVSL